MSTPIVQVSLGGNPLSQVQARALSGQIEESDGEKADKLTLEISNYDGQLQEPTTGQSVAVAVGWVETGLVKVGNFIITSVSQRGAKAVLVQAADPASLSGALQVAHDAGVVVVAVGDPLPASGTGGDGVSADYRVQGSDSDAATVAKATAVVESLQRGEKPDLG